MVYLSFNWFTGLFTSFVTVHGDYFSFGFTTLDWKPLSKCKTNANANNYRRSSEYRSSSFAYIINPSGGKSSPKLMAFFSIAWTSLSFNTLK